MPLTDVETGTALPRGFKRRMLKHLLPEVGPLLIFFLVFIWRDLIWATAVYAAVTVAALCVTWARHRKLPVLPLVSTLLVATFAGLTLALGEEAFIKMKPTVVNLFYASVFGLSWMLGYRLLEKVLEPEASVTEEGQRALTLRTTAYLLFLAGLNEAVWRTLPTEQWVIFKVFVMIALNLAFAWSQLPLAQRHITLKAPPADDRS